MYKIYGSSKMFALLNDHAHGKTIYYFKLRLFVLLSVLTIKLCCHVRYD